MKLFTVENEHVSILVLMEDVKEQSQKSITYSFNTIVSILVLMEDVKEQETASVVRYWYWMFQSLF